MKKMTLFLLLVPFASFGQNFHFSARLGIATYNGDLKANSLSLSQSRFMGSLGVRYDLTEHLAVRSYLSLGGLKADDKKGTDGMKLRNLNFKTGLFEWETGLHYSILNLNYHWWTPYVAVGIGLFHFNPKTTDENGNEVELQPLATEGQGIVNGVKSYKLTQLNIPLAIGVERMLNEDMRVGLEIGYRKTFTDYLDDASTTYIDPALFYNYLPPVQAAIAQQLYFRRNELNPADVQPIPGEQRGDPKDNDAYFTIHAKIGFVLGRRKR